MVVCLFFVQCKKTLANQAPCRAEHGLYTLLSPFGVCKTARFGLGRIGRPKRQKLAIGPVLCREG